MQVPRAWRPTLRPLYALGRQIVQSLPEHLGGNAGIFQRLCQALRRSEREFGLLAAQAFADIRFEQRLIAALAVCGASSLRLSTTSIGMRNVIGDMERSLTSRFLMRSGIMPYKFRTSSLAAGVNTNRCADFTGVRTSYSSIRQAVRNSSTATRKSRHKTKMMDSGSGLGENRSQSRSYGCSLQQRHKSEDALSCGEIFVSRTWCHCGTEYV